MFSVQDIFVLSPKALVKTLHETIHEVLWLGLFSHQRELEKCKPQIFQTIK